MSDRIVYCADGTWNEPVTGTNVHKMHHALALTPGEQYVLYDDGLGADGGPLERLTGGAFGTGLYKKIKDAYYRLANSFDSGSKVYLFGFSRGAYTVRCLAGMLKVAGLPTKPFNQKVVDTAFEAYRNRDARQALLRKLEPYGMEPVQIEMIGVWDTVGSLGIPAIVGGVDSIVYGFLDTSLHPDIRSAYHAIAIDERRAEFPPTLWTSAPAPGQTLEQVWFAGVHTSVGGGSGTGLSDITLGWMMQKAKSHGLTFEDDAWQAYADVDPKHALDDYGDSWNVAWSFPRPRTIDPAASLSNSVAIRCAHQPAYRPRNLSLDPQSGTPVGYSVVSVLTLGVNP